MLRGTAVSPGYAIGKAFVYKPMDYSEYGNRVVRNMDWKDLVQQALSELDSLIGQSGDTSGSERAIFTAQKEILLDEEITKQIETETSANNKALDEAVNEVFNGFIDILAAVPDPLIAARTADLRDVRNRLLRILGGVKQNPLSDIGSPVMIVAEDLLPSYMAAMNKELVSGIITETGSETSHMAILANSYGIPAIVGAADALENIHNNDTLCMDAVKGIVIINPDDEEEKLFIQKAEQYNTLKKHENEFLYIPARTAEGNPVEIGINIGFPKETSNIASADFIGLFRTEFMYMGNESAPSEQEQFEIYKSVLQAAQQKPVVLRTADIGGDKTLPYLKMPREQNPFLGIRGLRMCFANRELFRTQLKAALRASVYGPLMIMLPMVGSLDDIFNAKAILDELKAEMDSEGIPYNPDTKFGIMIEIPSIALIADLVAQHVDFASIGTNDLCQYLCAADRMNPELADYYQSYSPSMVRIIGMIADAFNKAGKPLSVCGEMAGNTAGAALLAGLGIRKLSMNASCIGRVKAMLSSHTTAQLAEMSEKAKSANTQDEIIQIIRTVLGNSCSDFA